MSTMLIVVKMPGRYPKSFDCLDFRALLRNTPIKTITYEQTDEITYLVDKMFILFVDGSVACYQLEARDKKTEEQVKERLKHIRLFFGVYEVSDLEQGGMALFHDKGNESYSIWLNGGDYTICHHANKREGVEIYRTNNKTWFLEELNKLELSLEGWYH